MLSYEKHETLQVIGDHNRVTQELIQQIIAKGVRKQHIPSRTECIWNGLIRIDLTFNIAYEEEIKTATGQQKNPLMMEDDVLRLIFQRILGIGHLIYSMEDTGNKLAAELVSLEGEESKPLINSIITDGFRLNLYPAKTTGMTEDNIAWYFVRYAKMRISISLTIIQ